MINALGKFLAAHRAGASTLEPFVDPNLGVVLLEARGGRAKGDHFKSFAQLDQRAKHLGVTRLRLSLPAPARLSSSYEQEGSQAEIAAILRGNMLLTLRNGQLVSYSSEDGLHAAQTIGKKATFYFQTGKGINFILAHEQGRLWLVGVDAVGLGGV